MGRKLGKLGSIISGIAALVAIATFVGIHPGQGSPTPYVPRELLACFNVSPSNPSGGDQVTLDGSCSHPDQNDPNGAITSWSWKQLHGHKVHLSDSKIEKPTFTAPDVSSATTLTFQLTVTDNHNGKQPVIQDVVVS